MYNSFNSWGWLDSFDKKLFDRIEVVAGDIRDANFVNETMIDVDIVFHLAAMITIPFSYQAPENYIDTNIKGTLNVLLAAKNNNVERILTTSTSEVYGTAQYTPIDEKHPLNAQSPYSASKIGADKLAESFCKSFELPVSIVRPFNTYGPRQSARAIIPTIITQLIDGNNEIKLGDLSPTRDLVFVKDTVRGFIKIAESDEAIGEEINIATGKDISIGDLATNIISLINSDAKIIIDEQRLRPKKSEVMRLLGSNNKLKLLTNWVPKYSLETGLKETIDWYKQNKNSGIFKSQVYNV
jgi:dTDP-glucose 4,6-dehydratase